MNIQVLGRDSEGYFYHTGEKSTRNVEITQEMYWKIRDSAVGQKIEYRAHSWYSNLMYHFDNGFDYQPVQVAPCGTNSRRLDVQRLDGTTETDAAWWARQGELR